MRKLVYTKKLHQEVTYPAPRKERKRHWGLKEEAFIRNVVRKKTGKNQNEFETDAVWDVDK